MIISIIESIEIRVSSQTLALRILGLVKPRLKRLIVVYPAACFLYVTSVSAFAQSEEFSRLDNDAVWNLGSEILLQFDTFHPQGLTRVGDYFFLSSVQVTERPLEIDNQQFDRSTGSGIGHLFKFDGNGELVGQIQLGEGTLYHPGGIDFDGRSIWVSVAEYRPDSGSIVYRIDPESMEAEEIFRFDDHLGAIAFDAAASKVHGVSWDSEFLYSWDYAYGEEISSTSVPAKTQLRGSRIAYQDCQMLESPAMVCSGIGETVIDNTHTLTIGGIELLDMSGHSIDHRIPVFATTSSGEFMVRNPSYLEFNDSAVHLFYFVPEDNTSTLYIYEVTSASASF